MGKTLKRAKKKLAAAASRTGWAHSDAGVAKPSHAPAAPAPAGHSPTPATVSDALAAGDFTTALKALAGLRKRPRLGAVMRWVRAADATGDASLAAQLLAAILLAEVPAAGRPPRMPHAGLAAGTKRWPAWSPLATPTASCAPLPDATAAAAAFDGAITVVARESGATRTPPSATDATIHGLEPGALGLRWPPRDPGTPPPPPWPVHAAVTRVPVPFVAGAFVLTGVLSPPECESIIAASEAMGYTPEPDYAFGGGGALGGSDSGMSAARAGHSERAGGVVWLVDPGLDACLFGRVAGHLPAVCGGGRLAGLNRRWRLYRYTAGAVYRPHVDGAWPGSGLDGDGVYRFDAYGDRWSQYTFLVYLNDGFTGGDTTFYAPAPGGATDRVLDARGVAPAAGCALVFRHGEVEDGSLVHEGALVTSGVKYVIRTDVLYMKEAA